MSINKQLIIVLSILILLSTGILIYIASNNNQSFSENEAGFEEVSEPLSYYERVLYSKFPNIDNWQRPEGPVKVGIQVGHWKNNELPDELERLRGSSTGARFGNYNEWEVALIIAEETARILRQEGMEVDILPATVPVAYWADLFISIHADGNFDTSKGGFKASAPWRDFTGRSQDFVDIFYQEYASSTDMIVDENITRNMRGYYAFNWFRNDHAIHPMTAAAILETGFLTNWSDRNLLVNNPELVAEGIANSVIRFLDI